MKSPPCSIEIRAALLASLYSRLIFWMLFWNSRSSLSMLRQKFNFTFFFLSERRKNRYENWFLGHHGSIFFTVAISVALFSEMTSLSLGRYFNVVNSFFLTGHATDDQFVKYVEDNPILWDNRCQDYKDCKEKVSGWKMWLMCDRSFGLKKWICCRNSRKWNDLKYM